MNPQNTFPLLSEEWLCAQWAGWDIPLAPMLGPQARMDDRAVPDPLGWQEPIVRPPHHVLQHRHLLPTVIVPATLAQIQHGWIREKRARGAPALAHFVAPH